MGILKALVTVFVGIGALFLGFAYTSLAYGFVVKTLWRWFVVSTFHVAGLPLVVAAGLVLLVSLCVNSVSATYAHNAVNNADTKNKWVRTIDTFAYPWVVLFFAWILTLFL